ncbi:MAG: NTP transferase domain-containing protein [Nanoarchaeota archaeon]|nr:NTP transferase domain-containing protein [Nanoarchaeota archaeon]
MIFKVCILAAGTGSRMSEFSKVLNKSLIPVQGKPAICHIIEKFPEDIEIIIATGHLRDSLITYLQTAYPRRKITEAVVDRYEGKGTGPGYSLLQCKHHLQCPFIFFASDTLVREEVPEPSENWFGVAKVPDTSRFCSADINEEGEISRVDDKVKTDNPYAFIGLAGVKDYEYFWENLSSNESLIAGEIQVSNGFRTLMNKNMKGRIFTWFDTGVPNSYKHALENYPDGEGYDGN